MVFWRRSMDYLALLPIGERQAPYKADREAASACFFSPWESEELKEPWEQSSCFFLWLCLFLFFEEYFLAETTFSVELGPATFFMTKSTSNWSWSSNLETVWPDFSATFLFLLFSIFYEASLVFSAVALVLVMSPFFSASMAVSQSQHEKNMSWLWATLSSVPCCTNSMLIFGMLSLSWAVGVGSSDSSLGVWEALW